MSLLADLRRRNVIRMAGLYLVGAWLITVRRCHRSPWRAGSISILGLHDFPAALSVVQKAQRGRSNAR
jgi:hypothetical protein